jgi:hypothetical protein
VGVWISVPTAPGSPTPPQHNFGRWYLKTRADDGMVNVFIDSPEFGRMVSVGYLYLNEEDIKELLGIFERGQQP